MGGWGVEVLTPGNRGIQSGGAIRHWYWNYIYSNKVFILYFICVLISWYLSVLGLLLWVFGACNQGIEPGHHQTSARPWISCLFFSVNLPSLTSFSLAQTSWSLREMSWLVPDAGRPEKMHNFHFYGFFEVFCFALEMSFKGCFFARVIFDFHSYTLLTPCRIRAQESVNLE